MQIVARGLVPRCLVSKMHTFSGKVSKCFVEDTSMLTGGN